MVIFLSYKKKLYVHQDERKHPILPKPILNIWFSVSLLDWKEYKNAEFNILGPFFSGFEPNFLLQNPISGQVSQVLL